MFEPEIKLLIFLFLTLSSIPENYASDLNQVCETPECHYIGEELFYYMNTSMDPCENFLEYAYGRHKASSEKAFTAHYGVYGRTLGIGSIVEDHYKKFKMFFGSCLSAINPSYNCLNKAIEAMPDIASVEYAINVGRTIETKSLSEKNYKLVSGYHALLVVSILSEIRELPDPGLKRNCLTSLNKLPLAADENEFTKQFDEHYLELEYLYKNVNIAQRNYENNTRVLIEYKNRQMNATHSEGLDLIWKHQAMTYNMIPKAIPGRNHIFIPLGYLQCMKKFYRELNSTDKDVVHKIFHVQTSSLLAGAMLRQTIMDLSNEDDKQQVLKFIAGRRGIPDICDNIDCLLLALQLDFGKEVYRSLRENKDEDPEMLLPNFENLSDDPDKLLVIRLAQIYSEQADFEGNDGFWESKNFEKLYGCKSSPVL